MIESSDETIEPDRDGVSGRPSSSKPPSSLSLDSIDSNSGTKESRRVLLRVLTWGFIEPFLCGIDRNFGLNLPSDNNDSAEILGVVKPGETIPARIFLSLAYI